MNETLHRENTKLEFQCPRCERSFDKKSGLVLHSMSHNRWEKTENKNNISMKHDQQEKSEHPDSNSEKQSEIDQPKECKYCLKILKNNHSYSKHKNHQCPNYNNFEKRLPTTTELENIKDLTCKICGKEF